MTATHFDTARTRFTEGLAHFNQGRFEAANTAFEAALAHMPGRPSVLLNLGATRLQLGRPEQALEVLEALLLAEPDSADALGHRATALHELGRLEDALRTIDRLLALQPDSGLVWSRRGTLLKDLRRFDEAVHAYEQAIAHGGDEAMHRYYIASLRGQAVPPAAPAGYVRQLFDDYAASFDHHLVQVLNYRAYVTLLQGLPAVMGVEAAQLKFAAALDLGCGTGLCAPLLRPWARRLEGVDLAPKMLDAARQRGLYDALFERDVAEHLEATDARFDLIVAADVFVYIGALERVFAGVARVLSPGGWFCFTVEGAEADAQGVQLRPSLRYAHALPYLRALATQHGLAWRHHIDAPIREDQRVPIPGHLIYIKREA